MNEAKKKRPLVKSNTQKLICSLEGLGNQAQEEAKNKEAIETYVKFGVEEFFMTASGFEQLTEENTHSYGLSCLGLDIFGPKYKLEDNKFKMSIEIDKES